MMDTLATLGPATVYPALFVGIMITGGLTLLPALYLALSGSVDLYALFVLTILAAAAADSFWYLVGMFSKKEQVYEWKFVRKRIREAKRFSSFYERNGVLLVFLAKFVYGTRIASHVLAGMHRIWFPKFLLAIGLGTALWFWILYILMKVLDRGLGGVQSSALKLQLLFLAGAAAILLFNWYTNKHLRRRFLNRKKS